MMQRIKKFKTDVNENRKVYIGGKTYQKFKTHLRKNKKVYIVGAICLGVGLAIGLFITKGNVVSAKFQGLFVNSPITNDMTVTIYPRHSRSIAMRDPMTGIPYGSINQAHKETGRSREYVRKNFETLGEVV